MKRVSVSGTEVNTANKEGKEVTDKANSGLRNRTPLHEKTIYMHKNKKQLTQTIRRALPLGGNLSIRFHFTKNKNPSSLHFNLLSTVPADTGLYTQSSGL